MTLYQTCVEAAPIFRYVKESHAWKTKCWRPSNFVRLDDFPGLVWNSRWHVRDESGFQQLPRRRFVAFCLNHSLDESCARPTIGVRSSEQESSTDTKKEWLFLLLCVGLALPLPHSSSIFRAPLRSFFIISYAIRACHCCCSICISCAVLTHTRSSPPPPTYACMFHRSVSVERLLRFFGLATEEFPIPRYSADADCTVWKKNVGFQRKTSPQTERTLYTCIYRNSLGVSRNAWISKGRFTPLQQADLESKSNE